MSTMRPEVRNQWIANLRSGKFKQGRSFLKMIDHTDIPRYCCLGVLAEQLHLLKQNSNLKWGVEDSRGHICMTSFVQPISVGLFIEEQAFLIVLNDSKRSNFKEIAEWIEHNI